MFSRRGIVQSIKRNAAIHHRHINNTISFSHVNHHHFSPSSFASRMMNIHTRRTFSTSHALRALFLQTMETPNPASQKFFTGEVVLDPAHTNGQTSFNFNSPLEAYNSPLAKSLFKVDGVKGVYLGPNFITITIDIDLYQWPELTTLLFDAIHNFYESGRPAIMLDAVPNADTMPSEEDDEVIIAIKEVLETKIRPSLQDDGGDVKFVKFEDGIVYLELQGSCTSCQSSSATLKHGIENTLMHYIPEVEEVRQIQSELDQVAEEEFKKVEQKIKSH